jgi:hypothetical protein
MLTLYGKAITGSNPVLTTKNINMKYKEELKKFIGRAKYDEFGGGYIWGNSKEGNQMIAQINDFPDNTYEVVNEVLSIRGWGAIQHMFPTIKDASEFQDELGKFIEEAINEKLERL